MTALDRSEPRTAAFRDALELVPRPGATNKPIVSGDQFEVVPKRSLKGEHVLVLDDTRTTGSRTQSAAPRTPRRRCGSRERDGRLGRWLSPTFGNNAESSRHACSATMPLESAR